MKGIVTRSIWFSSLVFMFLFATWVLPSLYTGAIFGYGYRSSFLVAVVGLPVFGSFLGAVASLKMLPNTIAPTRFRLFVSALVFMGTMYFTPLTSYFSGYRLLWFPAVLAFVVIQIVGRFGLQSSLRSQ